ncbi:MAG TPA: hypothetical protein VJO35_11945 [Terriglobales bacterium]|nr:hypothetical protein [Terriglobales bacterium]
MVSSLKKLCFLAGIAAVIVGVGCGGSGVILSHQTGNFTNASFKGSYVFQLHGFLGDGSPYRELGIVTSDGNGNITGGVDNVATIGIGAPSQSTAVTGTYSISSDGTGQALLNSSALGILVGSPGGQITLGITLASTSTVELMEADVFAVGSGVGDLQDSTAAATTPSGTFVFRLHDEANPQAASESEVGLFNISGGAVSGSFDEGLISSGSSLTISSGNITQPSSIGVGTITFTDSASVTTSLLYCVVNSTRLVLLGASSGLVGSGSAEAQSGSVASGLSGTYAFGSRGDDVTSDAALATVGQFTASGSTISSGALDAMQDGNYTGTTSFTGNPVGSPSAQGRVAVTLSTGQTMVLWLVSPARAFFLFENESAAEDGTADLQTGSPFSASTIKGQYALGMDGVDFVNSQALARVGTMQFDGSGKISLVELSNSSIGGPQSPGPLAGKYQVGGSGRITTQITGTNGSGPDLVMYAVSSSQAYALQNDPGENTSGIIQLQQ